MVSTFKLVAKVLLNSLRMNSNSKWCAIIKIIRETNLKSIFFDTKMYSIVFDTIKVIFRGEAAISLPCKEKLVEDAR